MENRSLKELMDGVDGLTKEEDLFLGKAFTNVLLSAVRAANRQEITNNFRRIYPEYPEEDVKLFVNNLCDLLSDSFTEQVVDEIAINEDGSFIIPDERLADLKERYDKLHPELDSEEA